MQKLEKTQGIYQANTSNSNFQHPTRRPVSKKLKNKPDFDNRTGAGSGVKTNYREVDRQVMQQSEGALERQVRLTASKSNYLDDIES